MMMIQTILNKKGEIFSLSQHLSQRDHKTSNININRTNPTKKPTVYLSLNIKKHAKVNKLNTFLVFKNRAII